MAFDCTRRGFLKAGSVLGSVALLGRQDSQATPLRPLRTAWLGFGRAARRHFDAGIATGILDCIGVFDPSREALEAAAVAATAAGFRTPGTAESGDAMLAAAGMELTVITSPEHWHLEQAFSSLAMGSHVLLESLPTRTWAGYQALVEEARRRNRRVAVAAPWRLSSGLRRAREGIAAGDLGPIEEVRVEGWLDQATGLEPATAGSGSTVDSVNWKQWLGGIEWPAEHRTSLLKGGWRRFPAFGCGAFSGSGFRWLDQALWLTGSSGLDQVTAMGSRRPRSATGPGRAPMDCLASGRLSGGGILRLDLRHRRRPWAGEPVSTGVIRGKRASVVWGETGTVSWCDPDPSRSWSIPGGHPDESNRTLWVDLASSIQAGNESDVALGSFGPSMASVFQILAALGDGPAADPLVRETPAISG
ncbi:MAG: Gfo/Idh/MocA family oxidoreductase [Limisphaerales bacterium]